jgi:hypothetical protein
VPTTARANQGAFLDGATVATGDGGGGFFTLDSDDTGLDAVGPGDDRGGNLPDLLASGDDHAAGHRSGTIGGRASGGAFSVRDRGGDAGLDRDGWRRQLWYGWRHRYGRRLQRGWSGQPTDLDRGTTGSGAGGLGGGGMGLICGSVGSLDGLDG